MAGLLKETIEGLGDQLRSIIASIDEANIAQKKEAIRQMLKVTEAFPALLDKYGDAAEPVVRPLITMLTSNVLRIGNVEVVVRGNVERKSAWGVEAKAKAAISFVGIEASGFYNQSQGQEHGIEVRVGYAAVPSDPELIGKMAGAWQERGAPTPGSVNVMKELMPLLEKLLGKGDNTEDEG